MVSKAKIKLIHSLERKKYRLSEGLFLAEGDKLVGDLLPYFRCRYLLAEAPWLAEHGDVVAQELQEAEGNDLERASLLKSPQSVLALFEMRCREFEASLLDGQLTLALDGVQDPGNMGTIIRLADWFGVRRVICSQASADIYSPKCVQATMGAIARVEVHYLDLDAVLQETEIPVIGTFMDGENIYGCDLPHEAILVMGNEGSGISSTIEASVSNKIMIPSYPSDCVTSESLNVATATAITLAEWRRRDLLR